MLITRNKPDPYCAFKCDKERRRALVSRDVRLVLIAVVTMTAGPVLAKYGPGLIALLTG